MVLGFVADPSFAAAPSVVGPVATGVVATPVFGVTSRPSAAHDAGAAHVVRDYYVTGVAPHQPESPSLRVHASR